MGMAFCHMMGKAMTKEKRGRENEKQRRVITILCA